MAKSTTKGNEIFLRNFGKEKITKESYWHAGKQRLIEKKVTQLNDHRRVYEAFVTQCYHGGRNESYGFGPSPIHEINDFDLKGAYTTGMVDMPALDYARAYPTTEPKDFLGHVCGYAKVKFKFASTVRFPCLPVSTGAHGLYYPHSGISYCSAPELSLALELGCEIEVEIGVITPCKVDDRRVFEPFVQSVRDQRAIHKKEGRKFEEQLWKEIGNSLYGKTAQGLKEKTSFDPRTGASKKTHCSALSNPYYAAHVTGFVRAVVSELIAKIPAHRTVYSVTTDGFLTDATMEELDCSGPLASRFKALAMRLDHSSKSASDVAVDTGNSLILERKHRVKQVVMIRTRGQLTGIPFPGENEVLLAKASVKPPMKDKLAQNDYVLDLFVNRTPGQTVLQEHLISTRDQWNHEVDLVSIKREVRVSLEFDFKRKSVNPRMEELGDIEHLAFDTVPWDHADEGLHVRAFFDNWRKTHCVGAD